MCAFDEVGILRSPARILLACTHFLYSYKNININESIIY